MKLVIHHNTHFTYSQPLLYTVQTLHLWPVSSVCQTVEFWDIRTPGTLHSQPDAEGNRVHSFSLVARPEQGLRDNSIVAWGTVSTHGVAEFTDTGLLPHPAFYLRSTALAEPHPRLAAWARSVVPSLTAALDAGRLPAVADLVALAGAVADRVRYRKGSTNVETTALEAFDWELGVCQDQAHVMVAVCRSIGLPARYVSGYFHSPDAPQLASHAWADVCIDPPARRWLSVDITHDGLMDERHVRLAVGPDYAACAPVRGVREGGGEESMRVQVQVLAAAEEVTLES
jgi:transglutaminase-like putative cysteine protease